VNSGEKRQAAQEEVHEKDDEKTCVLLCSNAAFSPCNFFGQKPIRQMSWRCVTIEKIFDGCSLRCVDVCSLQLAMLLKMWSDSRKKESPRFGERATFISFVSMTHTNIDENPDGS
jgi:hypothetical protein